MSYVTGEFIKEMREKQKLTQRELAEKIMVSDKTISKWETGKGLPDIGIIEDLAMALGVSVADLLTGEYCENKNKAANMRKLHFYVCPICGNIITSVGAGSFSCCGVKLFEQEANMDLDDAVNSNRARMEHDKTDPGYDPHEIFVETVEDEYHVFMNHEMNKRHYISFIAYVTADSAEVRKLYPEQEISVRFRKKGHGYFAAYCNRHGLVRVLV